MMYPFIAAIWFIRTARMASFYLYLWQLKEYHVGRVLAHFETTAGKRLFFNRIFFLKVVTLIPFFILLANERYGGRDFFLATIMLVVILVYLLELVAGTKAIIQKNFRRPVITKKTLFLISLSFIVVLVFSVIAVKYTENFYSLTAWLLLFDILIPLIISLIVLSIQPFAVLYRNQFILKNARIKRSKYKDLKVIGITGSYGKTSAKEFLYIILKEKFNVLKTNKHQNSEVGISKCILENLKVENKVFIVEMGAYGRGGIKLLAGIAKPQIGIITGINEQHMSLFGGQKDIIETKYELIESLPKDGLAVFNGSNKYCFELYKMTSINKKIYMEKKPSSGEKIQPDVWADNIRMGKSKITFDVLTKEEKEAFEINILGHQNVSNVLASVVVAKEMGMTLKEISNACRKVKPEEGSMKILGKNDDPNVIDSSYSSNPDGAIADLDYLNIWEGKKAIVMPCLIELGSSSKEVHRRIGEKIGEVCDLAIVTTKERFEDIKEGAMKKGMKEGNILLVENPEEVIRQLNIFSSPGDTVLLEGRVSKKIIDSLVK